ncbi:MAG: ISAs1 family transposase, partial [Rhabdochlamydiaceae bacterium]
VISFHGTTMRSVTGEEAIRHILSLFSHMTHSVLGQIGVTQKENEIPAFRRLLQRLQGRVTGYLFLGDALHTQVATAQVILATGADYLLVVKGNQKDLYADIVTAFAPHQDLSGTNYTAAAIQKEQYSEEQLTRKRAITTTVMTTHDQSLCAYLTEQHGFAGLTTVGILKRRGTRTSKDGTVTPLNETVCVISSRILSARQVMKLLRNHWCIENNLHWVKDFVFLEDRQTLRSGNAPQIMSFLRSMVISICNLLKFQSLSDAVHTFQKSQTMHYQFLKMAAIV